MTVIYTRPAYTALLARIQGDLDALPAVLGEPLSATWARSINGVHGHLDWIDAQCSPLTCELERLFDWAALYGVDRLMATAATGNVLATGNIGTDLLAGTLMRGTNGLDYEVQAAVTLGTGTTSVSIICVTAGSAGNLVSGQVLMLVDPVTGVDNGLTADSQGITGGAEDELADDWRARVALEWNTVVTSGARSGKPADYAFWARGAHPSVSGAIVLPHALGVGTVVVLPYCNSLLNRLPSPAVLDAVTTYLTSIAPATANWSDGAPIPYPITLSIHLLAPVDTSGNRAAIASALDALVMGLSADTLQLLWAEVDTVIAVITNQYTLDQSSTIDWPSNNVPVLQPINWI